MELNVTLQRRMKGSCRVVSSLLKLQNTHAILSQEVLLHQMNNKSLIFKQALSYLLFFPTYFSAFLLMKTYSFPKVQETLICQQLQENQIGFLTHDSVFPALCMHLQQSCYHIVQKYYLYLSVSALWLPWGRTQDYFAPYFVLHKVL